MRVLIQRVNHASVSVAGRTVGAIKQGLLLLVGFGQNDTATKLKPMAEKIANLRIFSNEERKFDLSLLDIKGRALLIPQFTLYADTSKGRRPDFTASLQPEAARQLFNEFVAVFSATIGLNRVEKGEFGAYMQVELQNDGPVTILLEM